MAQTIREICDSIPSSITYTDGDLTQIERRGPEATARQQGIFDRVWQHFVVEKRPFGFNGRACMFRTEDGFCCAVGLLIPDGRYTPDLEGLSPMSLVHRGILPGLFDEDIVLLNSLQDAHDGAAEFPEAGSMETRLRQKAELHRLTVPS